MKIYICSDSGLHVKAQGMSDDCLAVLRTTADCFGLSCISARIDGETAEIMRRASGGLLVAWGSESKDL